MSVLHAELQSIKQTLNTQNLVFSARSQVDDARAVKLDLRLDNLEDRVDRHGNRTTALETNVAAFFGDQGAFHFVVDGMKDVKNTVDKVIIAVGGAAVTGFVAIIVGLVIWLVERKP